MGVSPICKHGTFPSARGRTKNELNNSIFQDMPATHLLRIRHASQVVLVCFKGQKVLVGSEMKNIAILESSGRGFSVAVDNFGMIAAVGFDEQVDASLPGSTYETEMDATGMCVLPGLVDAHTHPVWVGDRVHEFAMKVRSVVTVVKLWRLVCDCISLCRAYECSTHTHTHTHTRAAGRRYLHGHPCEGCRHPLHSALCPAVLL